MKKCNLLIWWYVECFDYRTLLKPGKIHLIGEKEDGEIIDADVQLTNKDNTAYAFIDEKEYMLHPARWVTSTTDSAKDYWITDDKLDRTSKVVQEIRNSLEAGKAWKGGDISVLLFGIPKNRNADFLTREVCKIVPLQKGKHLAIGKNGNKIMISSPEKDEIKIRLAMAKLA